MFSLAHLSDVHLGPLPFDAAWRDFRLKRPVGYLSWRCKRRALHDPAVAGLIAADIRAAAPDHVALTGDMVNIAARGEFPRAAEWIAGLGAGRDVSFVPGNHDCYVACRWEDGLVWLAPWMAGDMRVKAAQADARNAAPFPYVRLRKNVALIGLDTGRPQPLRLAGGEVGAAQLAALGPLLNDLRERGYARVVLIHHPPLPGLAIARKALRDAEALRGVLVEHGAELVLHGHNHMHMRHALATRGGTCHVLGVASASMAAAGAHTPAAWHLCRIARQDGRWRIAVTVRGFDPAARAIATAAEFVLSS